MNHQEIEKQLDFFEGDVYFVGILPQFVWCNKEKIVKSYSEVISPKNDLQVYNTNVVNLKEYKNSLENYFKKEGITNADVCVFCINEDFYPKEKGNWIRIYIFKDINKEKNETKGIPRAGKAYDA